MNCARFTTGINPFPGKIRVVSFYVFRSTGTRKQSDRTVISHAKKIEGKISRKIVRKREKIFPPKVPITSKIGPSLD